MSGGPDKAEEAAWRPRILVIDDAPENVRFVGRIIKSLATVNFALGGVDGVQRAASLSPDLILLDVEMPDMSGYDVMAKLKSDPATRDTPVIFLTGRRDGSDEARGLEMGAIDYVTKPFNAPAVLARVRNHLRLIEYARRLIDLNHELERRATTDELTRLPNRRAFFDIGLRELTRFRRYGESTAVMLLDIDHFKKVNDTHGHDAGDEVLQEVARRLERTTRQLDCAARLGGEEFAILLPKTSLQGAVIVADRILRAMRETAIKTASGLVEITVTIGVTEMQSRDTTVEGILKRADVALYDGKRDGRDRYVVGAADPSGPADATRPLRVVG